MAACFSVICTWARTITYQCSILPMARSRTRTRHALLCSQPGTRGCPRSPRSSSSKPRRHPLAPDGTMSARIATIAMRPRRRALRDERPNLTQPYAMGPHPYGTPALWDPRSPLMGPHFPNMAGRLHKALTAKKKDCSGACPLTKPVEGGTR